MTVSFTTFKVFTCLETGALNFSFGRNAFHWYFFVIQTHTIYDVYHIVVIVHFHQCWCGHTVAADLLNKPPVQRMVQVR